MDPETQKLVLTEVQALKDLAGHENVLNIRETGKSIYETKGK